MRGRVLRLCLRAYPRAVRERDGAELEALATDLAADHGTLREALGLLRGGWAERRRRASRRRRTAVALTAATASVLAVLTWSAAAQPGRYEEERFGCTGRCADVEAQVAERVDDGWDCTESRGAAGTTWRCVRD